MRYSLRINGPVAAIVCTLIIVIGGGWFALVLTKTIDWKTGVDLLTHLVAYVSGAFTPAVLYWRNKPISDIVIKTDSDPPSTPKGKANAGNS